MASKRLLRILVWEPGQPARERWIERDLKVMQEIVGGYIEAVPYRSQSSMLSMVNGAQMPRNVSLICNEDGKRLELQPNRYLPWLRDTIMGTFFAMRYTSNGAEASLSDNDIKELTRLIS